MSNPQTRVARVEADGVDVFYREAGAENLPVVLLLHGFPSSSFQYRHLIHSLAHTGKYRVIAPDLPGFGFTVVPESRKYPYTFEGFKTTVLAFLDALKITKFAVYIFDYGAPTALRYVFSRYAMPGTF
jgi:pimeloyl-ACP methyl ester carboxylesterase